MRYIANTMVFVFPLLISCALSFNVRAQDGKGEENTAGGAAHADTAMKPAPALKKPGGRKKKTLATGPASEYKFKAPDEQQAYKFDKEANPIIKKQSKVGGASKKGKNHAAKGAKDAAGLPVPESRKTLFSGKEKQADNEARYRCPMGDYEGNKPGQCPKCGMTLEPVK